MKRDYKYVSGAPTELLCPETRLRYCLQSAGLRLVAVCSFACSFLSATGSVAQTSTTTKFRMTESLKTPDTTREVGVNLMQRKVEVWIEVEPVQSGVTDGINFVVEVVNAGATPIELYDPFDATEVRLVDRGTGRVVSLPPQEPDFVACHRGEDDPGAEIRRRDKDQSRAFEPTRQESSRRKTESSVKALSDVQGKAIFLKPDERLRMGLAITHVLADPEGHFAERVELLREHPTDDTITVKIKNPREVGADEVVPVGTGDYDLRVTLWIRDAQGRGTARPFVSDSIRVGLVDENGQGK